MNLDWYYTFVILAKTLNYRLASEEINLTIPSIHKQIKNLEQHLNVKLFETYKNQIILTEDGHTFLPIAQSFIEQYESGIKHIQLKKTMFEKYKIISDNHPEYWSSLKNNILNIYEKAQFLSINDVHTSIKLIEMNQGISFLPIYITTDSDYNISVINTKILQAPISFTYIYSKKESPEILAFIRSFKKYIANEQL